MVIVQCRPKNFFHLLLVSLVIGLTFLNGLGVCLLKDWRVGIMIFFGLATSVIGSATVILALVPWFDYLPEPDYFNRSSDEEEQPPEHAQ
jgi:hypothetical protein